MASLGAALFTMPRSLAPLVLQRKDASIPRSAKRECVVSRIESRRVYANQALPNGRKAGGPFLPRSVPRSSPIADMPVHAGSRNRAATSSLDMASGSTVRTFSVDLENRAWFYFYSDSYSFKNRQLNFYFFFPLQASADLETRIHEAMGAEIEAAVGIAVHEAMEAEMTTVQETVAEAMVKGFEDNQMSFDLRANFNTLVALTGIVIFERGVWTTWDVFFGDSLSSELASIVVGLSIMVAIRIFNIPLAEWRRPSVGGE